MDDQADMSEVAVQSKIIMKKALRNGSHTAILVYDKDQIVGAGGISYFKVMPTYHNQTGKKAYIMNMYTNPAYRRKGSLITHWKFWWRMQRKKESMRFLWRRLRWDDRCMKNLGLPG